MEPAGIEPGDLLLANSEPGHVVSALDQTGDSEDDDPRVSVVRRCCSSSLETLVRLPPHCFELRQPARVSE